MFYRVTRSICTRQLISKSLQNLVVNDIHTSSKLNSWTQAVSEAEAAAQVKPGQAIDSKALIGDDLSFLTKNIQSVLASGHPVINTISKYYYEVGGKHIRPLVVLLMSQAISLTIQPVDQIKNNPIGINNPMSNIYLKNSANSKEDSSSHVAPTVDGCAILPTQRSLAEIAEMIHTASLFHEDIVDEADIKKGLQSSNIKFGNKMAILGGDFLLARASVALAKLRNVEVVELLSTVIANLVEGELLQIKDAQPTQENKNDFKVSVLDSYIEKSYLKTAALIANSCKGAAILGGATNEFTEIAYEFGKNIGIAFQLTDDMLNFVAISDKSLGADLKLDTTAAPVLFAWEEFPELGTLIERKFSLEGDVAIARQLVYKSQGLEKTKQLAEEYCRFASQAIQKLPPSVSRNALDQLCIKLTERKK